MTDRSSVHVQLAMRSPWCGQRIQAWLTVAFALAALAATVTAHSQDGAPSIVITSPDGTRHLAGAERLAVEVHSEQAVTSVQFQVDGRRVCVRDQPPFECTWDAGSEGAARVVRVVGRLADGMRLIRRIHTPSRPRGGMRFTSSVDLVMVPVIVTDRRGNYVTDIEQNRFEVLEDGVPQDVIYFETASDRSSLDLAVAIDISASMTRTMPALKQSVQALIRGLRADDTVTLVAFNDRIFVLAQRESDRARLAALIDLLEPSGFTSLYDAIGRSLTLLDDGSARRAVLAFTDGDDRSSFSSLESVERRVENAGAPLYAFTLGERSEMREVERIVRRLAAVSGGQVFRADRPDRLDRALRTFREDVRNGYVLGYSPADAGPGIGASGRTPGGSFRTISVRIRNGRDYRLRTREGYRP